MGRDEEIANPHRHMRGLNPAIVMSFKVPAQKRWMIDAIDEFAGENRMSRSRWLLKIVEAEVLRLVQKERAESYPSAPPR